MRNDKRPEASQQYAAAHAAHYGAKDLRAAMELYRGILVAHPDTREAGYSRSQMQNIVRAVVPAPELLEAQVSCAMTRLERKI